MSKAIKIPKAITLVESDNSSQSDYSKSSNRLLKAITKKKIPKAITPKAITRPKAITPPGSVSLIWSLELW